MDTLEVAETLLGLSKSNALDEDQPDVMVSGCSGQPPPPTPPHPPTPTSRLCRSCSSDSVEKLCHESRKDTNVSKKKNKNKHTGATRRALNALQNFYLRAEELREFERKHKHCNVPQTYPDNQQLANWVARMRREKKKLDEDKQSMLDQSKVEYLEKIGFEWGQRRGDELWNARYQQLKDFYEKHQHTRVPTKARVLGRWVSTQRDEWRKMKTNLPSALDDRKVALLNQIDFCWDCHVGMNPWKGKFGPSDIISSDELDEQTDDDNYHDHPKEVDSN